MEPTTTDKPAMFTTGQKVKMAIAAFLIITAAVYSGAMLASKSA